MRRGPGGHVSWVSGAGWRRGTHELVDLMVDYFAVCLQNGADVRVLRELPGDLVFEAASFDPAELADHAHMVVFILFDSGAAGCGHLGHVQVEMGVQCPARRVHVMAKNASDQHGGLVHGGLAVSKTVQEGTYQEILTRV